MSTNLQSKLGEGLSKFQGGIEQGKLKLQTVQEINKIKKEIHDVSVKKSKILLEVGQKVYKKIRNQELHDQELIELTSKLTELDHALYGGSRKISELKSHPDQNVTICTSCETPNELDAKFCGGCGAKVEKAIEPVAGAGYACASCSEPLTADAHYCHCCGTKVSR
ncbi:zinc ribbon domain-containing protein [Bacillus haikouensis]|uniref:zinc ribbon domain-containing protein n=1 Tax=Bacillus haikouensis TaxID=1510468 RepID=UPI001552855A|nr:zinc ribbon domain-containing protein [Bacillus haikouensis]NQD65608.1 zinc ribbon domain-containing protein [Bacillus haikouensis]